MTPYDEIDQKIRELLSEVDCRIEHGAESCGHLEYVRVKLNEIIGSPEPKPDPDDEEIARIVKERDANPSKGLTVDELLSEHFTPGEIAAMREQAEEPAGEPPERCICPRHGGGTTRVTSTACPVHGEPVWVEEPAGEPICLCEIRKPASDCPIHGERCECGHTEDVVPISRIEINELLDALEAGLARITTLEAANRVLRARLRTRQREIRVLKLKNAGIYS